MQQVLELLTEAQRCVGGARVGEEREELDATRAAELLGLLRDALPEHIYPSRGSTCE